MKSFSIRNTLKLAAFVLLSAGAASAQTSSATATADATAAVVAAITITKDTGGNMNFGEVVAGATAGTVVLAPDGTRTATSGTTLGNAAGAQGAKFTVGGDVGATFAITLPSTSFNLTRSAATETMAVGTFTSSPSLTGTIATGGTALTVGATLSVGTTTTSPSGTYNSAANALSVTVAYN